MAKKKVDEKTEENISKEVHNLMLEIKTYLSDLYKNKYIQQKDLKFITSKLDGIMNLDGQYDARDIITHEVDKYKTDLYGKYEQGIIEVKIKPLYKGVRLPKRQFKLDAGTDAYITCFLEILENSVVRPLPDAEIKLKSLGRVVCSLGFAAEIPKGYYAQIVPRSGLAMSRGLTILNTPATIDAGYRDEWMAIVVNLSNRAVIISLGERICQIIIKRIVNFDFVTVEKLEASDRGMNGLGSTGTG